MSVRLRRKLHVIDEATINNKPKDYNENVISEIYDALKVLINIPIKMTISADIPGNRKELTFVPADTSKHDMSNYDFKNTKVVGDIIEAFCLKLLRDKKFKDFHDNHNGNSSPDFVIDNQYIEIKAHNNKMTNLSLGRLEKIEQSIISYFKNNKLDEDISLSKKLSKDVEKYLKMIVFVFNYNYDENEIIITDIKYMPLIYILSDTLQTKQGGSNSVIAKNFDFDEYDNVSFDDRVRQLYKAIKNKNK